MKRVAILLFLVLCIVGVVFLLMESDRDRSGRREGAGSGAYVPGGGGTGTDGDATGAGRRDGGAGSEADGDGDPNRIPGAPVTIRGRVVRDDQGVADASVIAARAPARSQSWTYRWALRTFSEPPPAIAKTSSGDGGYFELTIPRRKSVVLRAIRPGSAYANVRIFLPETGDPKDVTLRLREGRGLLGLVVDEKSEPVAGAPVELTTTDYWSTPMSFATTTDDAGKFAFEDLADGSYRASVEAKGYPATSRGVSLPSTRHVRIVLKAGGSIVGHITASDGTPVAGARLRFQTSHDGQNGRAATDTDATGAYRVENILPGPLSTAALQHPQFGLLVSSRNDLILPVKPVKAGEELTYDIRLEPGIAVKGLTVQADSGAPVANVSVALLKMNTQWRGLSEIDYATSDGDGRFTFPFVTKGTYALEAIGSDFGRRAVRYAQAQQPLTIDFYVDGESSVPEQRLEMMPMGAVRGVVLNYQHDPSRRISLNMQTPEGSIQGLVDDRGHFLFEAVAPTEQATVQSWNPQAKSDPFAVVAGETTEIELDTRKGGGFTGVVEDDQGRPIRGAMVQAMPETNLQWNLRNFMQQGAWSSARTDEQGRFFYAPQEWQRQNQGSVDWVVMARHDEYLFAMKKGFKLPKESETAEVRLTLKQGGVVGGRVEFDGGGPCPNARVTVGPKKQKGAPYETRVSRSASTDFDGRFEITGVGDGEYMLSAYYRDGSVPTQTVQAGDRGIVLVITPTEHIIGVVVDEDKKPVARAQVSAIVPSPTGESKKSTTTGQNGRFEIRHLQKGSYPLEVTPQRQAYGTQAGFEKTRVDPVATGTEDTVVVVTPGPKLEGLVRNSSGRPAAGAAVIAMPLKIDKKPAKPGQRPNQNFRNAVRPSAITNGRGEFELKGLSNEEVELVVLAEGHVPTTRRAVAGEAGINIRLQKGAEVEGRILKSDGTPLANQWFSLQIHTPEVQKKIQDWQERAGQTWNYLGGWFLTQGRTGKRGEFHFSSLLPGEYKIYLNVPDGVLPDVTLRTGAGASTLRLLPPLTIAGHVVDVDGNPIVAEGFQIWVNARQGQRWLRGSSAGTDGAFELKGMPPGTVALQVWAGNRYKSTTMDVTSGDLNVRVVLEAAPPPKKKKG